ncbi:dihydroneopterin aldolase family protein [Methanobacterium alcaliphilum]|uniref:dihydroneopterin aldolase family protein n=1 Tax=Methanobacterium alcaliphilum TaxID=392018 RepID=UPI00200AF894|nr:dihydroneopterin aldolase family protein [Methanobacterium alcaliphilum]MCK9150393.1 dihydroneopterin aldolase family protein [Methanobacterium alcaliphilum]
MNVNEKNGVNEKYFSNLSNRERAIFEGGISMGALFHQFIGTPVSSATAHQLEKTMEDSLKLQPCISDVKVEINLEKLGELNSEFDYISLSGDILNVQIISEFDEAYVLIKMEYINELEYPLMYVEKIKSNE